MMRRLTLAAALGLVALAQAQPAAAQEPDGDYVEFGWREATPEEKAMRKAYEKGKFTWGKDDGIEEMYDCMIAWQVWTTKRHSIASWANATSSRQAGTSRKA